jgi:hypothetical protein
MSELSEKAERLETLAREKARRAMSIEGLRKKIPFYGESGRGIGYHEKLEKLHRDTSLLFQRAAEQWEKTRKRNNALYDYKMSLEYAWRPGDKERLQQKIDELSQSKYRRGLFSSLSIIFLLASLFFVSFSLTGNAIASLSSDNLTLAGTGLFILGLVFTFFYIQEKKK